MADEADLSDDRIRIDIEQGIAQARSAPALRPRGTCHYCAERVGLSLLFCDRVCASDFEIEEDQLKRMGRR